MITREEALKFGLSFDNVYEERPFRDQNWQVVRAKENKKIFLWIYDRNGYVNLNVKVDPQWRDFWRSTYEAVTVGYHQNKEHWNTIILDGTIPEQEIRRMSRAVGNALHKNPDPDNIPCYRVVNSKGELAEAFAFGGENVQKKLLEAEGVEVVDGKVDLERYGLNHHEKAGL